MLLGATFAQAGGLTATLSQNGTLSAFYGADAFKEAYNAASDSAVITLSGGSFNSPSSIKKSITIIGNGAFNDSSTSPATTIGDLTVAADSVTIEGVITTKLTLSTVSNFTLMKSQVTSFFKAAADSTVNTNTRVEDSYVNQFQAIQTSVNCYINRCSIGEFQTLNSTKNLAVIENTNVSYWHSTYNNYTQPYAIYRNCRLGCFYYNNRSAIPLSSPSEFYDVTFEIRPYDSSATLSDYWFSFDTGVQYNGILRNLLESNSSAPIKSGSFSTSAGRGPVGHVSSPAIPEITSATIDNKTDGEGKLKVKINVTVH